MAVIERFEDIEAWQKGRALIKAVYDVSACGLLAKDFALRDQLRRAALSITANIAEGYERDGDRGFRQFLSHAKGSAGEVRSLLYTALDTQMVDEASFNQLHAMTMDVSRLLAGFIRYLNGSPLHGSKYQNLTKPI